MILERKRKRKEEDEKKLEHSNNRFRIFRD